MTAFLVQISHFMYSYNSTGNSCFVAYNQTMTCFDKKYIDVVINGANSFQLIFPQCKSNIV